MSWQVLIQSDVEPYVTITELLGQADIKLHWWRDEAPEADTDFGVIDAIYSYGHFAVTGALMRQCPQLKIVSNFGVGCDHIDQAAAIQLGIPVGNTPGVLDDTTADLTWALLLAAARNIVRGDAFARGPDFRRYDASFMLGQQVTGGTIGIVGLGRIGYQVAKRALGFDMPILYHNRSRNEAAEKELGARWVELDELLETSDFITLNMPLTEDTTGMIGAREFERMKKTAVVVNVARGPVWDQEALLATLRSGHLHAAATDVTYPEPLPRDHDLLEEERLVLLPHLGSATRQTRDAMARMSVVNLLAGLQGNRVPHRIA
ncbi:MAG: D-glycerate dehydrogenase [Gemmatimonadetes bacterium]|jgi:glyoxylate reductase|nr:D-glycerate dehydrogenase [Gemmatimonadota bacterium]MBT6148179.1 D-glycerate dehydrogenase [Gemmatimonadota bacterium]MBT7863888.1 D-glycerate dehydrogenase [Gemmatimonadota bacterium]